MKANDALFELIRRCRDGEGSPDELVRLESLLIEDEDLRVAYLRYVSIDLALETAAQAAKPKETSSWRVLALAAAFAILGGLVGYAWHARESKVAPTYVATLALAHDCRWEGIARREGERIAPGLLRLGSGSAVLRFDGGATVLLRGAVELEVRSRSRATLRSGEVMIRAEEDAAGFLLETPASKVTDLGTEFAVRVDRSGATEVHVLEGLVSYTKGQAMEGEELLAAGQAIRYDSPAQAAPRGVLLRGTRFDDAIRALNPRPATEALLARERFDYGSEQLPLVHANGGEGWAGPWRPAKTWPEPAEPNRDLRLGPRGSLGRLLDASNGFPQIARKLAQPIRMDRDGVYYVSALVRWEPGTSPVTYMRQVRLVLRCASDPKSGRYVLNMPTCLRPQIQRHDLEIFTSREKVPASELQRWVLKIVAHEEAADELHFRVFGEHETTGPMEPDRWHLSLTDEHCEAALDQLYLCTYLAPDPVAFGDIRIGTTWRSVTQ